MGDERVLAGLNVVPLFIETVYDVIAGLFAAECVNGMVMAVFAIIGVPKLIAEGTPYLVNTVIGLDHGERPMELAAAITTLVDTSFGILGTVNLTEVPLISIDPDASAYVEPLLVE